MYRLSTKELGARHVQGGCFSAMILLILAMLWAYASPVSGRDGDDSCEECPVCPVHCDIPVCNCTCICHCPPPSLSPLSCPPCLPHTSTPTPITSASPPPGYAIQPRALYKFVGCVGANTWNFANAECVKNGGYLAIPTTMSEVYMLVGMLMIHPYPQNHSCSVHIGFHDKDADGNFFSVLGEPMGVFLKERWGPGEPDGGEDNHCVTLDRNGEIGDEDCDEPHAFACEMKAD